jgi:GNAT superfamily N-acetyltransferase
MSPPYIADLALARRLDRAEALANIEFIEARARLCPESGACWIEVAGTSAMFDGVGSPITQTFGLGLFQPVTAADFDSLERFFQDRGADVFHEICPLADASVLLLLGERGYRPVGFSSVLYRPIDPEPDQPALTSDTITIRLIKPGEEDLWARTAALGWSDVVPELFDYLLELGPINANRPSACCFLGFLDGEPIAAAALCLLNGVALMGGACTLPEWRNRGAQRALLDHRLRHAAAGGCDIAMMTAQEPGGASQRNAQRHGFQIAYNRLKWRLAPRPSR